MGDRTIRACNRCRTVVIKSQVEGYDYSCEKCDENLWAFETYTQYSKEYVQEKTIKALNALIDLSCVEKYPNREHDQTMALNNLLIKAEQGEDVSLKDIITALSKEV